MRAKGSRRSTRPGNPGAAEQRAAPRRDVIWLLVIVAAAFCLRLIYVLQFRSCPFYGHEIMDPLYHDQWAKAFAAGEAFVEGAYFRAPLYPWFLGAVYWLFGTDPIVPRIVQAVLGSLSCGLLFLIGRQVFSRTAGILAGLGAATYWIFLYFDAELLIVVLIVFLDLLLLWLLLRVQDRPKPGLWLASGFVLGLSAIARPNILLFAPAVLIWLAVMHRGKWRRVFGYAACFVVGCACPILPITIRNHVVGHDTVLISSQGGVNFYIGNNPQSDGITAIVPGTPAEWWAGYYATIERAEKAAGRKLKGSEVSRHYWSEAWKFMRDEPSKAAALMLKKLGLFWTHGEISNNQNIGFVTDTYAPIVKFLPLAFWLVGPLGVLGLLLSLRQARRLFPLWGFVIIYMLSVVAFFVTARYRVPVVAVLIVLGSYAVCWFVDAIRRSRWKPLAGAVLVLLL
ncbi:MAG: glycosyltransferase family 39 protein, partial [Phycisphaerae bacterium]|nr:glycosyltransferase family 39 protein [Phycisphaerae bacterium]